MSNTDNRLEEHRKRRKMSQERLAELAGVTRQTIANLEGGSVPSYPTAVAIARALKVKPEAVFPVAEQEPAAT